jgi:predicted nucleic acid-binding protein
MTVLVDTGVLYADHDMDAARHDIASDAIEAVYDGEFGQPYISDYIFDEVLTLTRQRTQSHTTAIEVGHLLRGQAEFPKVYGMVHVSAAVFAEANDTFERYDDQNLSFTDATSIALLGRREFDGILSFESDFDGLVTRFEPEEA